jgi:hypothetical protein
MGTKQCAMLVAVAMGCAACARAEDDPTAAIQALQREQQQLLAALNSLRAEVQALHGLVSELRDSAAGSVPKDGPSSTIAGLDQKLDRILTKL